ncbi:methyltransferase-like protein 27 [Colossoma macropomum]|uniref:methyltransferase-like protein 27 n=1 Tax=Colossoma macropomum TaxID=42526 RepID=UPI001864CB57|nr:methyltransferase-like protein 27 [Colossoma macropomum]XP_036443352.1 methyltransferase-like protein 27 [Colossoma macropomum]
MADNKSFAEVKNKILSAHKNAAPEDKLGFYNTWAENYEQDVAVLDYRAPLLAAECIASFFKGDKGRAIILDVACGTGLVSAHLRRMGFCQFVGVDGSEGMLDLARKTGLYQELKQCMLGQDTLPVQNESYDIVVIVGALSVGQVPVGVIRELWQATKPGGYVCMTTRGNADNQDYKKEMERMVRMMEEEKRWSRVTVNEVEKWERAVSEHESGYIPGTVYLYQRTY